MVNINQSLDAIMTVEGAQCAALVDSGSGMLMGAVGTGVDMEIAAAGNTEVVRSKLKTMRALSLNDSIEDMLITLGKAYHIIRPMAHKEGAIEDILITLTHQYHIIRPVAKHNGLFIYYVLDRNRANLAMARRKVQDLEAQTTL